MRKFKKLSKVIILVLIVVTIFPALQSSSSVEAASTVKLSKSKLSMNVGDTNTLKVSGTSAKASWKSSKNSIATVTQAGKVTAKSTGTATITATVSKKNYSCKVTVTNDKTELGKVTSISGKKVTLALIEKKEPSDTKSKSSKTNKEQTLSGKSITIEISDNSILHKMSADSTSEKSKKGNKASSATLSDIKEGSTLKITYTSSINNLKSVVIMGAKS